MTNCSLQAPIVVEIVSSFCVARIWCNARVAPSDYHRAPENSSGHRSTQTCSQHCCTISPDEIVCDGERFLLNTAQSARATAVRRKTAEYRQTMTRGRTHWQRVQDKCSNTSVRCERDATADAKISVKRCRHQSHGVRWRRTVARKATRWRAEIGAETFATRRSVRDPTRGRKPCAPGGVKHTVCRATTENVKRLGGCVKGKARPQWRCTVRSISHLYTDETSEHVLRW